MRIRNHLLRLSFRGSRSIAAGLSVALLLSLSLATTGSSASSSASATNVVVPATGTVAGKGYAYWLQRMLQIGYATSASAPPFCMMMSVGGRNHCRF